MGGIFGGGGGSSGGGGTTTTNTSNQSLPWSGYVPPETYAAYREMMPKLMGKYDTGLTPMEKSAYTGQVMSDTTKQFAGAGKSLNENLARSGVGAKSGAAIEANADLARSKAMAGSQGLAGITGMDLQQKNTNLNNIMKGISLPGSPVQVGSTSATNYAPNKGSGGGS